MLISQEVENSFHSLSSKVSLLSPKFETKHVMKREEAANTKEIPVPVRLGASKIFFIISSFKILTLQIPFSVACVFQSSVFIFYSNLSVLNMP